MIDEKIYVLEDKSQYIIIETILYNKERYMLLKNRNSEDTKVGYERDNNLYFLNSNEDNYNIIVDMLIEKAKSKL